MLILILTGAIGGSDDKDSSTPGVQSAQAILQPVGGQAGTGKVELGKSEDQFAARLEFTDLAPTNGKDSYVLWATGSVGAFPLDETGVKENGTISKTIPIPAVVLCSIATDIFPTFKLSRLNAAERKAVIVQTSKAVAGKKGSLPAYKGKTAFEGPIVIDETLKNSVASKCNEQTGTTQ